ncbi:MAG: AraC family transcriptional regulator [bacterium]|nr:AraC family transcriptional regulator [bacterium]
MPRKQKSEVRKQAQSMKAYVEKNCAQDLKLSDLSRDFGYSEGHICRMFKNELGIGFVDCLTRARLNAAKRLLRQTRLPIYEIATRAGFNFRDYFFKVFKKAERTTPRRYRMQNLQK